MPRGRERDAGGKGGRGNRSEGPTPERGREGAREGSPRSASSSLAAGAPRHKGRACRLSCPEGGNVEPAQRSHSQRGRRGGEKAAAGPGRAGPGRAGRGGAALTWRPGAKRAAGPRPGNGAALHTGAGE